MNALKSNSYLMEVDALLVRSCLFLMPFNELAECDIIATAELLDILYEFTNKVPQNISGSTVTVSEN